MDGFSFSSSFPRFVRIRFFDFAVLTFLAFQTKALSLEELDQVFAVSTKDHAFYQLRQVPYWFGKNILRRSMGPQEILYPWEAVTNGVAEDVKTGSFNGEKAA